MSDATLLAAVQMGDARELGSRRPRHEQLRRMLVAASSKSKPASAPLLCRALERSFRHWRGSGSAVCDENCFFCCPAVIWRSAARLIADGGTRHGSSAIGLYIGMGLVQRRMSLAATGHDCECESIVAELHGSCLVFSEVLLMLRLSHIAQSVSVSEQ